VNDTLDIWCKCFFGYVGKDSMRLCAMDDKPMACKDDCPYKITRREANDICKEVIKSGR
jgi:hypothetical protein